jgi:DNA mismatch repair protein MutS2
VPFAAGDRVHLPRVGTGRVLEVRNAGRVLVVIKERTMVVKAAQLEPAEPERKPKPRTDASPGHPSRTRVNGSLDLHGQTVEEALSALDAFLSDALLASLPEVRVIHGRSGGVLRAAIQRRLRRLPVVRSFCLDPRNMGVTIVSL